MMARAVAATVTIALGLSGLALAASLTQSGDRTSVAEAGLPPIDAAVATGPDWHTAGRAPGNWIYLEEPAQTLALFGESSTDPLVMLHCNRATRQVGLARPGVAEGPVPAMIRTETQDRAVTAFPVAAQGNRPAIIAVEFSAEDRLLDAIAFSRGRFTFEVEGQGRLVIPPYPEMTRVIEDCRQ